jgi:RNA polymerase sigma factor (sigma-70 family)
MQLANATTTIEHVRDRRLKDLGFQLIVQARRKKLSPEQAEDVAQEAISRALARGLHHELHLEAWATVVARHLCFDELRREVKVGALGARLSPGPIDDDAVARVDDQDHVRTLHARIARLPARQGEVIIALMDGLTLKEVADQTGTTVRSVESHLLRARRTLRRSL